MKPTTILRFISNQTLELLKKRVMKSVDEAPQYIKALKENKQAVFYDKVTNLNKWYTKIIGLDEVTALQNKVITIQDQLLDIQERRREVGRQLAEIRQKSIELQDQIHKVKRHDDMDKFLDLMKQETEILKLEQNVSRTFQDYDRTEREIFTALTNAIRDSQEKQRSQMEYTRYFGLVLGIAGSFLTFVYSTIRKHDLKRFIEKNIQNIDLSSKIDISMVDHITKSNEEIKNEIVRLGKQVNMVVKIIGTTPVTSVNSNSEEMKMQPTVTLSYGLRREEIESALKICAGLVIVYLIIEVITR